SAGIPSSSTPYEATSRARRGAVSGSERGSTLLLFPAAVLVVFVLGAIAADLASVFLGERELANATAAAANDTATEALANAAFYRGGQLRVADAGAQEIGRAHV